MAVLPVVERVLPIVTAPTASPAPVAVGGRCPAQVDDMTYGLELGGCALRPPPQEENPSRGKTLGLDGGGGKYGDGNAERCSVVMGVESTMGDVEGGWVRWEWGILPWHR